MWSGKPDARTPEKRRDGGRWLETERSEDSMTKRRDTWMTPKSVFMLPSEPKSRLSRSQSTHSSEEAG
jgi:hypothetical protein